MQSWCLGPEGSPSLSCSCSASLGCPHPAQEPGPHVSHLGLSALCPSRAAAGLVSSSAQPCLAMGTIRLGPPTGPCPGLASTCLCPQGGAQGWGCPMPMVTWLRGVSVLATIFPSVVFRSTDLALSKFGLVLPDSASRGGSILVLTAKTGAHRGSVFFFFFFFSPKLLTLIVYILQYYYSCYELPKAATSKYCRAHVVPAQIIATNAGLPNLGLISLFK